MNDSVEKFTVNDLIECLKTYPKDLIISDGCFLKQMNGSHRSFLTLTFELGGSQIELRKNPEMVSTINFDGDVKCLKHL